MEVYFFITISYTEDICDYFCKKYCLFAINTLSLQLMRNIVAIICFLLTSFSVFSTEIVGGGILLIALIRL